MLEDSSGKIWIGGKNGLKSISEQGEVKEFYTYEYYFTHAIEVEGMIYFSTMESELLIYDMKRGIFEEVTPAFNDAMTHLFRLSSHELLVFFDSKGVWIYDISYGTFHQSGLNCEKNISLRTWRLFMIRRKVYGFILNRVDYGIAMERIPESEG